LTQRLLVTSQLHVALVILYYLRYYIVVLEMQQNKRSDFDSTKIIKLTFKSEGSIGKGKGFLYLSLAMLNCYNKITNQFKLEVFKKYIKHPHSNLRKNVIANFFRNC